MKIPSCRFWFVLGCAGCAQLAGFEDFSGEAESAGGASGGGVSSSSGGVPGGGRTSGGAGSGVVPVAGTASDGGEASSSEAGAAGTSDASGGRATPTGGATNGGRGGVSNTGGSVNGGATTGGAATGGTTTGGSATGGSAAGGTATGGTSTGGRASGGDGCGELLINGDFASGSDGWAVDTSYPNLELNVHPIIAARGDPALVAEGVAPYSDDYLGWLGGVPDSQRRHEVSLSQTVTLPQNVIELTFTGAVRIVTEEVVNDAEYDTLYIELLTAQESLAWQFAGFSNQHAGGGWFELDSIDPWPEDIEDTLRGRTFTFIAYARTDEEWTTHFWLDSLSLMATCAP